MCWCNLSLALSETESHYGPGWHWLYRPGWPLTHRSKCLCLSSAGIKVMYHHGHLNIILISVLINLKVTSFWFNRFYVYNVNTVLYYRFLCQHEIKYQYLISRDFIDAKYCSTVLYLVPLNINNSTKVATIIERQKKNTCLRSDREQVGRRRV